MSLSQAIALEKNKVSFTVDSTVFTVTFSESKSAWSVLKTVYLRMPGAAIVILDCLLTHARGSYSDS